MTDRLLSTWRGARRLPRWGLPALLAVVILLLPAIGAGYDLTRQVQLTLILALIVSGLNLSLGYGGQPSFGQAAMYAAGAYTAGLISIHWTTDIAVQVVAGGLVALLVGIVTGIPGLRLGSWSLAMTSFFLVLLLPDIAVIFEEHTGGHSGLSGISMPTLFGHLLDPDQYYLFMAAVTIAWFVVMRNVVTSRHGVAFQTLKQSPVLAASVGMSVYRTKLTGYALGAIPAGLAGALFANMDLYLSLEAFNFHMVTAVLAASILGGSASIYGALVGAAIIQYANSQTGSFQEFALVFFGVFLLVGGVLFNGGLAGVARRLTARLDRLAGVLGRRPAPDGAPLTLGDGESLVVEDVQKAFGGNRAVDGVSLTAPAGRVTALIGPNGSGKTTLLNLVCGYYRLDAGSVSIGGKDLHGGTPDSVARRGVARTFQTPLVPPGLTVREVVSAGRYVGDRAGYAGAVLRTRAFRRTQERDLEVADRLLAMVGLLDEAESEAADLPLGMRRMLEVARALATEPSVLLLDEAASGLDEGEVERLADLVRTIRDAGCTVILVEHNYDLVLSLSDEIVVLARGRVLARGGPEEISADPAVRKEYLGIVDDADAGMSTTGADR